MVHDIMPVGTISSCNSVLRDYGIRFPSSSSVVSCLLTILLIGKPPVLDPNVVGIRLHSPQDTNDADDNFLQPWADTEAVEAEGWYFGLAIIGGRWL